jgi:hypothetical protein
MWFREVVLAARTRISTTLGEVYDAGRGIASHNDECARLRRIYPLVSRRTPQRVLEVTLELRN